MKSAKTNIYALGIVAHPDDESFLFAGTSLKLAAEGKTTAVICATKGEKGADRLGRNLTKRQMAAERVAEGKKAAKIIKLVFVKFYNYPDGGLDQINFSQLVSRLTKEINHYQPKIILTFGREGISGHKDHIAIGKAAIAAAKQAKTKPEQILLASVPQSAIKAFNQHLISRKVHHTHFKKQQLKGVADSKLLQIDIKKYSKEKHRALKAHKSQYLRSFVLDIFQRQESFEAINP